MHFVFKLFLSTSYGVQLSEIIHAGNYSIQLNARVELTSMVTLNCPLHGIRAIMQNMARKHKPNLTLSNGPGKLDAVMARFTRPLLISFFAAGLIGIAACGGSAGTPSSKHTPIPTATAQNLKVPALAPGVEDCIPVGANWQISQCDQQDTTSVKLNVAGSLPALPTQMPVYVHDVLTSDQALAYANKYFGAVSNSGTTFTLAQSVTNPGYRNYQFIRDDREEVVVNEDSGLVNWQDHATTCSSVSATSTSSTQTMTAAGSWFAKKGIGTSGLTVSATAVDAQQLPEYACGSIVTYRSKAATSLSDPAQLFAIVLGDQVVEVAFPMPNTQTVMVSTKTDSGIEAKLTALGNSSGLNSVSVTLQTLYVPVESQGKVFLIPAQGGVGFYNDGNSTHTLRPMESALA